MKKLSLLPIIFTLALFTIACNGAKLEGQPLTPPTAIAPIIPPTPEISGEGTQPISEVTEPVTEVTQPTTDNGEEGAQTNGTDNQVGETSPILSPEERMDSFEHFLKKYIVEQDITTLKRNYMSDRFIIGHWQSEGLYLTAQEAADQFKAHYLHLNSQPVFVDADLNAMTNLLGQNPLDMWGPDVNAVKALYSEGWGPDANGAAILVIAHDTELGDEPYWQGMIYANGGFVQPGPAPAPSGPTRISFDQGGTSAVINGRIDQPGSDDYLIRALQGQLMTIRIDSPNNDVRLSLHGVDDGQPLSRADTGATYWRGTLAATQDYAIGAVHNGSSDYTLTVEILPVPSSGQTTQQLQFAPGSTGTTVSGALSQGFNTPDTYIVQAREGQFLYTAVSAAPGQPEPVVMVRSTTQGLISPDGFTAEQPFWMGRLPITGQYEIVVNAASPTSYALDVQIVDGPINQVQFAAGSTGTAINGRFDAHRPQIFALNAAAGQVMSVSVDSQASTARVTVEMDDAAAYLGHDSANHRRAWVGVLPKNGTYYVMVTSDIPQTSTLYVDITTPPTPQADASCPAAGPGKVLLATSTQPFCFLYPAGLSSGGITSGGFNGISLATPPLNASLEPVAVFMSAVQLGSANGKTAVALAQERVAQNGGIGTVQETLINGYDAAIIEGLPSPVAQRHVIIVHNGQGYELTFGPYGWQTPTSLPSVADVYDMVTTTFTVVE